MKKMKVVKLCVGCDVGGHGARNVWDTVLAVDVNNEALATYVLNHTGKAVLSDVLDKGLVEYAKNLNPDVIFNSSGCQGFSSGQGKKMADAVCDPRNDLYVEVIRSYVSKILPQWYIAENVVNVQKFPQFKEAVRLLYNLGYNIKIWQMDAADFGVAQSRTRIFLVARRGGTVPDQPKKNVPCWPNLKQQIGHLTEEEAICQGVADIGQEWNETMKLVPEGKNWKSLPYTEKIRILLRIRWLDGNWYRRYAWTDTAKTLCTKPVGDQGFDPYHPSANRPLSVVEHMILQGMPWKTWQWPVDDFWTRYRLVGNGIPSVLVKAVAETIAVA